ncbi:MAG TPA: hypothetical protein VGK90_04530 [Rhizomicrobium sp.]
MRHAHYTIRLGRSTAGESLLFSAAFLGVIIALTSALYLIDVATMHALLSVP